MSWTRQLLKIYYISFSKNFLQANETGGSYQTELEGVKRCFGFLQRLGVKIGVFISDRHRGIAKWIRENCPGTTHFFDIWHVARSVTKKLLAASKEKGCEIIQDWMKGIRRHLYWSATSTKPGFGSLILAKWNSFLRHVANKHTDHPDPLYKVCNHGNLPSRKWIKIGEDIIFIVFIVKGHSCWNIVFNFSVPKVHVYPFIEF